MRRIRNSRWAAEGRWRDAIFLGLSDPSGRPRSTPLACRLALHAWNTETIAPEAVIQTCCACGTERVVYKDENDGSRVHPPEHGKDLISEAWPTAGVI